MMMTIVITMISMIIMMMMRLLRHRLRQTRRQTLAMIPLLPDFVQFWNLVSCRCVDVVRIRLLALMPMRWLTTSDAVRRCPTPTRCLALISVLSSTMTSCLCIPPVLFLRPTLRPVVPLPAIIRPLRLSIRTIGRRVSLQLLAVLRRIHRSHKKHRWHRCDAKVIAIGRTSGLRCSTRRFCSAASACVR